MITERNVDQFELWFLTGSQHLYGPEVIDEVERDVRAIVDGLNGSGQLPVKLVPKPVLTTSEAITRALADATASDSCVGVVAWMHTFSPSQMWLPGLKLLGKPIAHLHTQLNREIPWDSIDMDYMNLHQSAHGGREFGFAATRLGTPRKVIVGHWKDADVQSELGAWSTVALAHADARSGRIARFGDNMRRVAVTEGNKVSARATFGYSVEGFGVGDLVEYVNAVSDADVDRTVAEYEQKYSVAAELRKGGERHEALRYAARQELGLRGFLEDGDFIAFTTTFEDLHGLDQLPGFAPQRLMEQGYGFGAEGDWKTSAFLRAAKVMAMGRSGGTSFMEDYTYNFNGADSTVLGSHMLETCPTIAEGEPSIEIHPLGIGGKSDPVRAVFDAQTGPARNATMVDLGSRYRLIINEVNATTPPAPMPKLPVARVLWKPEPDLRTAAASWILAGGAHHTVYTQAVTQQQFIDYARMTGVEVVVIGEGSTVNGVEDVLHWNELYYRLKG
ncbi:MAG: L-arabinose isomerase [Spirochaetia bacterium]